MAAFAPGLLARHLPNGFRIVVPEAARHALFPLFSPRRRITRIPDTGISPSFAVFVLLFRPINLLKFNVARILPLRLFYYTSDRQLWLSKKIEIPVFEIIGRQKWSDNRLFIDSSRNERNRVFLSTSRIFLAV